jgi:hypothetical protein
MHICYVYHYFVSDVDVWVSQAVMTWWTRVQGTSLLNMRRRRGCVSLVYDHILMRGHEYVKCFMGLSLMLDDTRFLHGTAHNPPLHAAREHVKRTVAELGS